MGLNMNWLFPVLDIDLSCNQVALQSNNCKQVKTPCFSRLSIHKKEVIKGLKNVFFIYEVAGCWRILWGAVATNYTTFEEW